MKNLKEKMIYAAFMGGIILLIINFLGLVIPLENKEIHQQKTGFKNDIS